MTLFSENSDYKLRLNIKGVVTTAIILTILFGGGYVLTNEPIIEAKQNEYSIEQIYKVKDDQFLLLYQRNYGYPTWIYEDYDSTKKEINITFRRPVIYFKFNTYKIDRTEPMVLNYKAVERVTFNGKEIWNIKDNGDDTVPKNVLDYLKSIETEDGSIHL